MGQLFNPENFLWKWCAKVADFVLLSCCWTLCCIPVVTAVPASIALYDAVARCVRGSDVRMFQRFFRTFKNELLRGILLTVLWGALAFLLNAGYQLLLQLSQESGGWDMVRYVYFFLLLVPLGIGCWAVAVESRYANSFPALHKTAFFLNFARLPYSLAIVLLLVAAMNAVIRVPFLVMIVPGFAAYLQSFFIEKVFAKITPAESDT